MTPEKQLILNKFNTLKYMDNNIASIIDDYIYAPCMYIYWYKYSTNNSEVW